MDDMIQGLIARSRSAQVELSGYTQEKVDAIVHMFGKVVFDHAAPLAKLAYEESRMGVYEDKVAKNRGKSLIIWNSLKDKRSVGMLSEDAATGIMEVAKPMGVVVAVTPCTNPAVTPMCNAMFAVKCANSIIIAPHPRGKLVAKRLKELYDAELDKLGAPRDVFLVCEEPSIELTAGLMKAGDVVIATGGSGMVKAAYSSGKPSFGVGPGNVQAIFDRGIDIAAAVAKCIAGRCFDNGIICSGEQSIIAPREDIAAVKAAFIQNGALWLDDAESVDKIRAAVFPNGSISQKVVGQSVKTILELAGLNAPENVRVIVVEPPAYGAADLLSKEKMCPLMCAYRYDTWEEAVDIALANLNYEGKGHSASLHTENAEHIRYAGLRLPVSRLLVNQTSSTMAGGAFANGLNPTTTLGCGSWGNNAISENLSYFHLMNKTRIARVKPDWKQPSDEEIWQA